MSEDPADYSAPRQIVTGLREKASDDRLDEDEPAKHEDDCSQLTGKGCSDKQAEHGADRSSEEEPPDEAELVASEVETLVAAHPDESDAEREHDRRHGQQNANESCGERFRSDDLFTHGVRQECLSNRPVAVLRRRDQHSEEHREEHGRADDADQVAHESRGKRVAVSFRMNVRDRCECDDRQLREQDAEDRPRRGPDLEQLRREESHDVSSRNACSSDEVSATSSWRAIPFAAARSPILAVVVSATVSRSPSDEATRIPASSSTARSRSACGLRTRIPPAARAAISAVVACSTNLPRWMITTSSTICSTSARTWLEMKIVRPSAASERKARGATGSPADRARSPARRG